MPKLLLLIMSIIVQILMDLLEVVHKSEVCKGNFEDKYTTLPNIYDGILMNQSSVLVASRLCVSK